MDSGQILITGGSGVVGSSVLKHLDPGSVVALTRNEPVLGPQGCVAGDITRENLGLDPATYRDLCNDTSTVIHCAADTNFGGDLGHQQKVNIDGTRNILQFTDDAGASLVHLSTAFVQDGISELTAPSQYEETKREAERLVTNSSQRVTIIRPSIVVGGMKFGPIHRPQGFHLVVAGTLFGRLPFVPADDSMFLDFVDSDYLAEVIVKIVLEDHEFNEVWVTQGDQALKIVDMVDQVNAFSRRVGLTHDPVKPVPYEQIERLFVPVFLPTLPEKIQSKFRSYLQLVRYMNVTEFLPSSRGELKKKFDIEPQGGPKTVFETNLEQIWEESNAR